MPRVTTELEIRALGKAAGSKKEIPDFNCPMGLITPFLDHVQETLIQNTPRDLVLIWVKHEHYLRRFSTDNSHKI